ncbi:MAG: response regulator [Rhodospirillaceae bacterium]|nr:response regulator [Rhodospirillaceae bacterium]
MNSTSGKKDDIIQPITPMAAAGVWAAMSHEIRTPLMGVVGMLEILSRTPLTDEQRRIIATVGDSSVALMRIVDDVLDLAKLESARLALTPVSTDLTDLMEGCAEVLANQADSKGLAVICEVDPRVPQVMCDALRVRQVLLNFGANAVKFTETGHVSLGLQVIEAAEHDVRLRFTVADTGIGIPDDLHVFLFKPFSQLAVTAGQGRGGVGLGLAICRNLVEAMGGKITIDSVPGKGTRFHVDVIFPAIEGELGAARLDGRTVVAVDAGEPAMRIAVAYLEAAGARVQRVKTLNNLTQHDAGLRSGGHDPPVILIGPDAEAEDVETATSTLRRTMPNVRLSVLWLYPRAVGGALSLARRGVRGVRAHPLRRNELLGAVAGAQANIVDDPTPVLTRRIGGAPLIHGDQEAAAAARADGRVILVAEDNVINQQVLRQQLAILGFDCDMANSGGAALQALRERSYLLLLCDCHMPGIDGFELTRLIRAQEKESGKHLPIIAVTANAMPGESDRCRAAGMDDYLAKPIEIRGLQGALARWLGEDRSPLEVDAASKKAPALGAATLASPHANLKSIDLRNLTAVFGNDPARLKPVLDQWRVVIGDSSADLNRALAASEWEDAIGAAHRIKGSAGIAGAHTLSAAAVALETALRMGDSAAIARAGEHVLACATAALTEVQVWSGTLKAST